MSDPSSEFVANPFLAILLGASEWPLISSLAKNEGKERFIESMENIRQYLTNSLELNKETEILDLFDDNSNYIEIDGKISEFLSAHIKNGDAASSTILIYYIGHGDFVKEGQKFQMLMRSTDDRIREHSGYLMNMLATTVTEAARKQNKIIILDCCYAASAFADWQMQSDDIADKINQEAKLKFTGPGDVALLCACPEDQWALNKSEEHGMTMFTSGLIDAFTNGDKDLGNKLSLSDIHTLATQSIKDRYGEIAVIPSLTAAKGQYEDVVLTPLLPNMAKALDPIDIRISELEQKIFAFNEFDFLSKIPTLEDRISALEEKQKISSRSNSDIQSKVTDSDGQGPWTRFDLSKKIWSELSDEAIELLQDSTKRLRNGIMLNSIVLVLCVITLYLLQILNAYGLTEMDLDGLGFGTLNKDDISRFFAIKNVVIAISCLLCLYLYLGLPALISMRRSGETFRNRPWFSLLFERQFVPNAEFNYLRKYSWHMKQLISQNHQRIFSIPLTATAFLISYLIIIAGFITGVSMLNFYGFYLLF